MRPLISILFLIGAVLSASATILTATIDSRTSASLTCDPIGALPSAAVQYSNTGNKGQITQGNVATLTLSGLPKGTIHSVTLYMHSNTKSGAATVAMTIGQQSWQVASGNFKDWPGMSGYTTDDQTLACLPQSMEIASNASLRVTITGTANSVYWSQMVVHYTEAPKEPHTVTLHWYSTTNGWCSQSLTEPSVSAGVSLPQLETADCSFFYESETWTWLGWSEQSVELTSVQPIHWQADDLFLPEDNTHLYALYASGSPYTMLQDTSFTTGEYALLCGDNTSMYALTGAWQEGRLALTPVAVQSPQSGRYIWSPICLPSTCRYNLTFTADSLTIHNVGSDTWIGHSEKNPNQTPAQWAWRRAKDGSIYISSDLQLVEVSYPDYYQASYIGMSLSMEQGDADNPYILFRKEIYSTSYLYWLLYPTADLPEYIHVEYTTFPSQSSLYHISPSAGLPAKVLAPDGCIRIVHNNLQFNILGNPL